MLKFKASFDLEGINYPLEWHEVDDFSEVPYDQATQVYGINLLGNQVVLVINDRNELNLPGGSIEADESYEQTLARETIEETNMKVIKSLPLGYQVVTEPNGQRPYQLRMLARVEKLGEFVSDPAGTVRGVKLCDLRELNKCINYGKVGERLIRRASELRDKL